MTQRNTLDPDPAGPPPPDELDSILRQWHAVNAEQAAAGRDRLLERIRAQERARKRRPTADRAVAGSLTAFFLLIRSALVNRYSPAAALMVFIVIFAVLFPSSQGPAMAQAQVMMVPEGGRLDAIDDEGNIIGPCPLKHTDVDVSISGFLTRVIVTQTYHNPYHDKIEAVYTFPLSHRAAVDRMTMTVGDRVVVGEVKERGLARRIYEAAKAQNYVASLLEQERPNIFTQSVANIEPGTEVVVQIAYVEVLQLTDGSYSFDFPMVVGPRYVPGAPMTSPSVVPAELTPRDGVVLLGPAALGVGAAGEVGTLGSLQTGKLRALLMAAGPVKYPGDTWWGRGDATGGAGQATLWYRFEAAYTDGSKEFGELYTDGTGQLNGRWFYTDPKTIAGMGTGFSPDTNQVPDASRVTPEPVKPGTRAGHDISLTVTIDSGGPGLVDITSELHEINRTVKERRQDGIPRRVTLTLTGKKEIPNRDFVLSWRQTAETIQEATFVHTSSSHGAYSEGAGGFFTLILQPPDRVRDADVPPRELIFVMDTSGSMRGFPIAKSKQVMTRAIDAMRPGDTFNVITFAGFTDILWDAPRPANEKNRAQAKAFVESRRGSGGTEMMQAIKKALEQHVAGQPGALAPEQLADLPADGRAVEVAVGYERIRVTRQSDLYEIRIREDLSVTFDLTDDLPPVLQPHGVTVRLSGRWQTIDGRRVLVADRAWLVGREMPTPPMRIVLFLTDGFVGNDMAIIDAVRSNAHTTRVFGFGIGNSVNRYLIDGMARAGRGEAEFVLLESDGDEAVARFTRRVQTPVLTDIQLAFSEGLEVTDIIPAVGSIPDLFDVKPLVIHGRYTTPGTGTLTILGRTGAGPYERSIELQLPADAPGHDVTATVWARARVDEVLAPHLQAVQQGNPPETVRNEVISLGESFGIMTQYTSFVAVEKSRMTIDGKPVLVAVPIEMPQGVSYEGVFGGGSRPGPERLVALNNLSLQLASGRFQRASEVMQFLGAASETHSKRGVVPLTLQVQRTPPGPPAAHAPGGRAVAAPPILSKVAVERRLDAFTSAPGAGRQSDRSGRGQKRSAGAGGGPKRADMTEANGRSYPDAAVFDPADTPAAPADASKGWMRLQEFNKDEKSLGEIAGILRDKVAAVGGVEVAREPEGDDLDAREQAIPLLGDIPLIAEALEKKERARPGPSVAGRPIVAEMVVLSIAALDKEGKTADARALADALVDARPDYGLGVKARDLLSDESLEADERTRRLSAIADEARDAYNAALAEARRRARLKQVLEPSLLALVDGETDEAPAAAVRVTVLLKTVDEPTKEILAEAGLAIEAASKSLPIVVGMADPEALEKLALLEVVRRIEPTRME